MDKRLSFGTDGIRAHEDDFALHNATLFALGKAIAYWICEKYADIRYPGILIARDTRASGNRIKKWICLGLSEKPVRIVDAGILPTPAVFNSIKRNKNYHCGLVISASHNPFYDNGIKLFDALLGKISDEDQETIISYFHDFYDASVQDTVSESVNSCTDKEEHQVADDYLNDLLQRYPHDLCKGLTIVLDCAYGATYQLAPLIFERLGAHVIPLFYEPDGKNINHQCGALHPEKVRQAVIDHKADVGFAFDGDGDRLVAVGSCGDIKNGDDVLFLLSQLPEYNSCKQLVGTVMSNTALEQALNGIGKTLVRTAVGDRHVVQMMNKKELILGGEVSGHTIIAPYLSTSDGIFVALELVRLIVLTQNNKLHTFEHYPMVLKNMRVPHKKDLTAPDVQAMLDEYRKALDHGRILVRYSGTEPLLRIMVEAKDQHIAHFLSEQIADDVINMFSK